MVWEGNMRQFLLGISMCVDDVCRGILFALTFFRKALYMCCVLVAINTVDGAYAEEPPQFITDDEIETALEGWLKDFFKVAGVSIPPRVFLLKSNEVNAGATFGGIIIVYTGLIIKCKNVLELLGVLAHETGHIAGGHMAKSSAIMSDASVPAVASLLLGAAGSLLTGNPGPLMAGLAGGAHVFERSILKHSREQEDSADASAITYLTAMGWSVSGLGDFLDRLKSYTTGQEDPYIQTHPLSSERKEKIRLYQKQQAANLHISEEHEKRFQRIKAKLIGFTKKRSDVYTQYPLKDKTLPARYARLIANYNEKKNSVSARVALRELDALLMESPNDPYFLELKGQFCFETGQISESLPYLREAAQKCPKSYSTRLMLAHALIESPMANASTSTELREAVEHLTKITEQRPENTFAWRLFASAYGKMGQAENAAACLAEEAFQLKQVEMARAQAKKGEKATNFVLARRSSDILQQLPKTE